MFKLLVIDLLISLFIYLLSSLLKLKEKMCLVVLSMIMPIIGAVIVVFYIVFKKIAHDRSKETMEAMIYKNEENLLNNYSDSNISIIPIKDALVLNEKSVKRRLIIHAIKDNPQEYVLVAKEALIDNDTETSHYAASVLSHLASKLPEAVKEDEDNYLRSGKDGEAGVKYYKSLKAYIDSKIDDNSLTEEYEEKYILLLKELIAKESEECYYKDLVNILIKRKRYDEAEKYIAIFKNRYRKLDEPYIAGLKLAYHMKDFNYLKNELDALRKSDIHIQGENLKLMRYWINEVDYEK